MSVQEGLGVAPEQTRKSGAVLVFLPLLIALIGVTAIYLGKLADDHAAAISGYGIDDLGIGAIAAPIEPVVLLDR